MAKQSQQPLIEKLRSELEARAAELRPLVGELEQIEAALQSLPKNGSPARRPTASGGRRTKTAATAGRNRVRPGRSERFLGIIKAKPGITVAQVAKEMGVPASGLYAVQRTLTKKGKLKKSGMQLTVA